MKKVNLMFMVLSLNLFISSLATAADWQVVYQTDFSSDPAWTTNAPSKMYWDSATERYHLERSDIGGEYTFVPISHSPELSYKLEFDITIVRADWAGEVPFGLGDASMNWWEPVSFHAMYSRGDGGRGAICGYVSDSSGGNLGGGYEFIYDLDTPYHNVIIYDRQADSMFWEVTRISDGVVVANQSKTGVGTFTGIDRLYCASIGDMYAPTAVGEAYIDNIVLSEAVTCWQVVYQTDFSTDPSWETNSPSEMYWDQSKGAYHLKLTDCGNQYTFVEIPYSSLASYKLEFDLRVVRLDWAGMVSFGLGDADMHPYEPSTWGAYYGRGDGGNGTVVHYFGDTASGHFPGGYDFLSVLNTDYHNVVVYDRDTESLSWQVTRISDGAVVADYSASGVGSFTGIDRLYSSRVGYCYAPGATGEAYIDNVVLSVCEPPALTGRIAYVQDNHLWLMDASIGPASASEVNLPYEELNNYVAAPQWCSDGSWLTFQGGAALHQQIYIVRPDGTGFRRVTNGSGDLVQPCFSPDCSQIAFEPVYGNLYIINTDGTDRRDLERRGGYPCWSPDGRYIAYSNWAVPTYNSDLFLYDLTTGNSTQITHHLPWQAFNGPAWSPDGTKLAASVCNPNTGSQDICTMNADGSALCNLTADWATSNEGASSWSSDGQYIVFQSDISGNWDIWYMRPDGSNRINISNSPQNESEPAIGVPETALMVQIDIKPGSCPNPLNVDSQGVLPIAILGSQDFDANSVDPASVRLAGVAPIRSSLEDVATLVADANECECTTIGPDGYTDLTVKFKTQDIVEELVTTQGEPAQGDVLTLALEGALYDGTLIEGADCVVVVGKVPKPIHAKISDVNGDGVVNMLDFVMLAGNWLESATVDD